MDFANVSPQRNHAGDSVTKGLFAPHGSSQASEAGVAIDQQAWAMKQQRRSPGSTTR
jgi:hypothetical protein